MIARLRSTWTDGMLQFLIDYGVPRHHLRLEADFRGRGPRN